MAGHPHPLRLAKLFKPEYGVCSVRSAGLVGLICSHLQLDKFSPIAIS